MRVSSGFTLLAALSFSVSSSLGSLVNKRAISTDVCAEIDAALKVPNLLFPGKFISIGSLKACICASLLGEFVDSNVLTIAASVLVGKSTVLSIIAGLINDSKPSVCQYPEHAVPGCAASNPCFFSCSNGYTPSAAGVSPPQCVCLSPNTECNGKCGKFGVCPSANVKRDIRVGRKKERVCPQGLTACGVLGRSAKSWECVDTEHDLESCGGCLLSLYSGPFGLQPNGEDCTAIRGVSDVSCISGACVVHRCMPGFDISHDGASCTYSEDKDPAFLAAEYGLEHVPL